MGLGGVGGGGGVEHTFGHFELNGKTFIKKQNNVLALGFGHRVRVSVGAGLTVGVVAVLWFQVRVVWD